MEDYQKRIRELELALRRADDTIHSLRQQLARANERAWGNEDAARELWQRESDERGRQGIYG